MNSEELVVGMQVRYPRTGTAGRVARIERQGGNLFAEIDTTGLLYRADQLVPVSLQKVKEEQKKTEDIERVKKELEFISGTGFQEAISHSDQSCEGGG